MRKVLLTLFLVSVFLALPTSISAGERQTEQGFPNYHARSKSGILSPRIGSPAILAGGSSLDIYLEPGPLAGKELAVRLVSPFNMYEVGGTWVEISVSPPLWKLSLEVPKQVVRDMYDLVVYAHEDPAVSFAEPNSVFIIGESYPDVLKVGVISDLHYGVGSYYAITTKILRRTLDALSAQDLDLIVCCGDVLDATAEEVGFSSVTAEFSRLRTPILLASGNNDHFAIEKGLYHWERYLAPEYYSVGFGPYYFLVLNSRSGMLDEEQLIWAEKALSAQPKQSLKVLVLHHPYWAEAHPSLSVKVPTLIKTYGIGLVLMGHTHRDEVRPEPTLSIVTGSLSDGMGYRFLNLTHNRVEYAQKSLPWDSILVDYLQPNDYTSTGLASVVNSRLATARSLRLTFLLKSLQAGTRPTIEGGEATRLRTADVSGGKASVELRLNVPSQSEKVAKVFFEEDRTPPLVKLSHKIDGTSVVVLPSVHDAGLGVLKLAVYCSEDNVTWITVPLVVADRNEQYRFTASKFTMYLKIEAMDAGGLTAARYGTIQVPDVQPKKTEATDSIPLLIASIVFPIVAVCLTHLVLKRRKHK